MKIPVLDHGYVEFVEGWGHGEVGRTFVSHYGDPENSHESYEEDLEVGIIEAARQSTKGSFRGWAPAPCDCDHKAREDKANSGFAEELSADIFANRPTVAHRPECASIKSPGDAKLLRYLHENSHSTPFEFAGMVIEVQAPIFIFREWHRHRTQSYNEMSARYAPLPDLNYIPDAEVLADRIAQAQMGSVNRQAQALGQQEAILDPLERANEFKHRLRCAYEEAQDEYDWYLKQGIPKEIARLVLPVGRYSKMRASANLRNWLSFLTLRCDPKAQWEIQQYANAVANIIAEKFPQTFKLWDEDVYGVDP